MFELSVPLHSFLSAIRGVILHKSEDDPVGLGFYCHIHDRPEVTERFSQICLSCLKSSNRPYINAQVR